VNVLLLKVLRPQKRALMSYGGTPFSKLSLCINCCPTVCVHVEVGAELEVEEDVVKVTLVKQEQALNTRDSLDPAGT
jgi:hypothetical protein